MAINAQAPIVPVAITGGRAAMRKGSAIMRPVQTSRCESARPVEDRRAVTADERDAIDRRGPAAHRGAWSGKRPDLGLFFAPRPGVLLDTVDMELLVSLGRTLGFSLTSGVNLYATVAILGLAARFDWVALPPQYQVFANDWIIGVALSLYAIEFVADKIPWVDSLWDTVHTFIRPAGGALVAVATLGEHRR